MGAYDPSLDPANQNPNNPANQPLPQVSFAPGQTYNTPTTSAYGYSQGGTTTGGGPVASAVPGTAPSYAPGGGLQPATPHDIGVYLDQAGTGENVSQAYLQHYSEAGTPTNTNNAADAYSRFSANAGPAPDADMSRYYDNASRLQANAINTQMAARGSYGSSNAIGQIAGAETNLRAQQARDEAQYGLQRGAYGLSRAGAEGQLAGAADASGRANSADERDWMQGITGLGFQNQEANIMRGQTLLGDQKGAADTSSGIQGRIGQQEIDDQKDLLIKSMMAQGMSFSDAATAASNQVNDQRADSKETTGTVIEGAKAVAPYFSKGNSV